MTLEELISENIVAVKALTAALLAGGTANGTADRAVEKVVEKPPATNGKAGKVAKPKHTYEQVSAAIMKVKEEISRDAAREMIEKYAGAGKKLGDIANLPDKFDAIVADCDATIANKPEPEPEPEPDDL